MNEKPKEEYWKVTKQEIGMELGNPNYVKWLEVVLAEKDFENERLKEALVDILECLDKRDF